MTPTTIQMKIELEELDAYLAEARAELAGLREERLSRAHEFPQEIETLRSGFEIAKDFLEKTSRQLNMYSYKKAILQARATVSQPYVITKEAVLCHVLHQCEVTTKQLQMMKLQNEEVVSTMKFSMRQIEFLWESRMRGCNADINMVKEDIQDLTTKMIEAQTRCRNGRYEHDRYEHDRYETDRYSYSDSNIELHHLELLNALSLAVVMGGFHGVSSSHRKPGYLPFMSTRKHLEVLSEVEQKIAAISLAQRRVC